MSSLSTVPKSTFFYALGLFMTMGFGAVGLIAWVVSGSFLFGTCVGIMCFVDGARLQRIHF